MSRTLKLGVSRHPLLIAIAVAGALSAGIMTINTVKSAEPDSAMPSTHHERGRADGHMDRCAMISAYMSHIDKKLSPDQVHDIVAGRLAQFGEGTLKVGKITTKEPGVVSVEIDTTSGSLVTTREISTKTGFPADLERRCEEHADEIDGDGPMGHGGMERFAVHDHMLGGLGGMGLAGGEHGRDLNLNVDQVKKLADAALILVGNPRLKVGAVKEKDGDTVTVDVVTVDNALVLHREVDRHTGRIHRAI
ncbi:MAG: hypothetical protein EPO08_05435 [Rhodospirillaceae bacterium]|nr:MAG: hypothetical protein EPO08_05435 [Rhodospirillaceae bacterium]